MRIPVVFLTAVAVIASPLCQAADQAAGPAEAAVTSVPCPLCGTATPVPKTAPQPEPTGNQLDLKPVGVDVAAVYAVPVCPKCHFVLLPGKLEPALVETFRRIVASDNYRKHGDRVAPYLVALTMEAMQAEAPEIASRYLDAAYLEEAAPAKFKEDLTRSVEHFRAYVKGIAETDRDDGWCTAQLLIGELLRRMGSFAEAEKHFQAIGKMDLLKDYAPQVAFVLALAGKGTKNASEGGPTPSRAVGGINGNGIRGVSHGCRWCFSGSDWSAWAARQSESVLRRSLSL